jgi:hypothetical protein
VELGLEGVAAGAPAKAARVVTKIISPRRAKGRDHNDIIMWTLRGLSVDAISIDALGFTVHRTNAPPTPELLKMLKYVLNLEMNRTISDKRFLLPK